MMPEDWKQPFFGESWPSGVCDDGERVPTPVGQECALCGELILADHQGTFIYEIAADLKAAVRCPVHRECSLREVLGGWGHHVDHAYWCGDQHDPDGGLTYRESAMKVWESITL